MEAEFSIRCELGQHGVRRNNRHIRTVITTFVASVPPYTAGLLHGDSCFTFYGLVVIHCKPHD